MQYVFTKTGDPVDNVVAHALIKLADEHPFDALMSASGPILRIFNVPDGRFDVWSLATFDATDLLEEFSRWCALQVTGIWKALQPVCQFLKTGDELLRAFAAQLVTDAYWPALEATTNEEDAGLRELKAMKEAAILAAEEAIEAPAARTRGKGSVARAIETAACMRWTTKGTPMRKLLVEAQRTKFKELVDNAS